MADRTIQLTKQPLKTRIMLSGVLILVACLVMTFFFGRFVNSSSGLQTILLFLLWIVLPASWLLGSFFANKKWPSRTYTLTDSALICKKRGGFGSFSEELYLYETIRSINVDKQLLGGGTLTLTFAHQPSVVIHDVLEPEREAKAIKAIIAALPRFQVH